MSSTSVAELDARIARREREAAAVRRRIRELEAELAAAKLRQGALEDLWGFAASGEKLPLRPLVTAIVGAVAANASAFCGFVVLLTGWSQLEWTGAFLLSALVAATTFLRSNGHGAGGRARVGLRRMTIGLLVLGMAFGVAAGVVHPA